MSRSLKDLICWIPRRSIIIFLRRDRAADSVFHHKLTFHLRVLCCSAVPGVKVCFFCARVCLSRNFKRTKTKKTNGENSEVKIFATCVCIKARHRAPSFTKELLKTQEEEAESRRVRRVDHHRRRLQYQFGRGRWDFTFGKGQRAPG